MIRILKYGEARDEEIFALSGVGAGARDRQAEDVAAAVSGIIDAVRQEGDRAVLRFEEKFDGARLPSLEVPEAELDAAMKETPSDFLRILERAARNIENFHSRQTRTGFAVQGEPGVILGQRVIPMDRVGVYVPGGTAAYPSTVQMNVIPAKIAGCGEVVMTTPPGRDGRVIPLILAAARTAGADRVFRMGGAQAVAALAWGTESVPRVDKIVGPGNVYVAEAKRQVFGRVAIDMIAGPSEILIVADGATNPAWAAADMLSQAEHDRNASAVLVTDSPELAEAVARELEAQLERLSRREIARASIEANGRIIVTKDLPQAIDIANAIAPEHLELCLEDPFAWLPSVRHAGSVFLGRHCPVALGDYMAGPNHTLPTSGTARFSSPLSVDDFVKRSQYIYCTAEGLAAAAEDIASFASLEGLNAHAESALIRMGKSAL